MKCPLQRTINNESRFVLVGVNAELTTKSVVVKRMFSCSVEGTMLNAGFYGEAMAKTQHLLFD